VNIGQVPWTKEDMSGSLEEFAALNKDSPVQPNIYGMRAPHMFLAWFVLKWLQPSYVIESGVAFGQGSWFFEKACPNAKLHCIEPCLEIPKIFYKPANATYHTTDFTTIDWSGLSRSDTVVFFDDHQDAFERLKQAQERGFIRMMFEDNYAVGGDCHSLKKAFLNDGQAAYLRENLMVYHELPPVIKPMMTRGGTPWDHSRCPTPEPLLTAVEESWQQVFEDEASHYTWICYVEAG
jgi:hypothetical protein